MTMIGYLDGCLRDIQFHGSRLHYLDPDLLAPGVVVTNINVETGCPGKDVCSVNPCPVNTYCKDVWNQHECPCLPGWEGE